MAWGLCWEGVPNGLEGSPHPCSRHLRLLLVPIVCSLHLDLRERPTGSVLCCDPLDTCPASST